MVMVKQGVVVVVVVAVVVVVVEGNTRFWMPHLLLEKDNGK